MTSCTEPSAAPRRSAAAPGGSLHQWRQTNGKNNRIKLKRALFLQSVGNNRESKRCGCVSGRHLGVDTCGFSPDLDSLKTETTCRKKLESCSVLLELGFLGVMSSCTHRGPMALSNNNTVLQALYTHHQQHHTQVTQPLGHVHGQCAEWRFPQTHVITPGTTFLCF